MTDNSRFDRLFSPFDETGDRNYILYLLIALVFLLLVVPIAESSTFSEIMLRLGIVIVPILASVATRRRKIVVFGSLMTVALVVAPTHWLITPDQPFLFAIGCLLESILFIWMAVAIIVSVMKKHLATIHSIFGAIAAYLLLGVAWAVLYWGLDHLDDGSILEVFHTDASNDSHTNVARFSEFIYFSFVTMSTLGYGDVVPNTPIMRTVAWMQSVVGQFYMAVLVAWMVSEIPTRRRERDQQESTEPLLKSND